ncbi:ABC transporter ATP-binding protein/permease [Streptococcus dentiloxodontae]
MSILELRDIHKSYYLGKEKFPVLKGIDLSFDQGDFVSILGESGGGKSTLMNIIGGLDRDYEGDVLINGTRQKDKKEKSMDQYRRETIGFIFQSFNLINYLSVLDNVMISLRMTKLSHSQQVKRANDLLKQVGLYEHRKKKPAQLSGGQKQRVAIARALASDPDIIIADEPTGALDSQNTKEVLNILQGIAQSGKTIIVVTHSQEVADSGTRIVRLTDGKITGDERLRPSFSKEKSKDKLPSRPLKRLATWKMAWSHFRTAWKQNLIITIGTAIGLFSVMFFLGLGNGATRYMNSFIDGLTNPQAFQVYKPDLSTITNDDMDKIKAVDHIKDVQKGYMSSTFDISYKGKSANELSQESGPSNMGTSMTFMTVSDTVLASSISSKSYPNDSQIVLSETQAQAFVGKDGDTEDMVGKTITLTLQMGNNLIVTKDFTVSGIQSNMTMVTYSALEKAVAEAGGTLLPNLATAVVDDLNNTSDAQDAVAAIKENGVALYTVTSIGDLLDNIVEVTSLVSIVLAIIAGISLIVSVLMIVATTYMSVTERTKEIGVLRAMGGRRKDIRRLFVNESLLLGLSANILAIATAFLAQWGVNKLVANIIDSDIIQISAASITVTVIMGLLIALIASIAPSAKAARLNPIEALAAE